MRKSVPLTMATRPSTAWKMPTMSMRQAANVLAPTAQAVPVAGFPDRRDVVSAMKVLLSGEVVMISTLGARQLGHDIRKR